MSSEPHVIGCATCSLAIDAQARGKATWAYCPSCGSRILPRHKLTPTGDHARDRLVRERLNLRREDR